MKTALLLASLAAALYACGRDEPVEAQTRIDETRQVEQAAEAGRPLNGDAKAQRDAALTQIVKSALQSDSSLDTGRIDVENRGGDVALHGTVASEEQKEKAGRIAASVGGVRNVANNLAVDASAPAAPSASTGATADPDVKLRP